MNVFVTMELSIGHLLKMASLDICPAEVALSRSVTCVVDGADGAGTQRSPLKEGCPCADGLISLSGYIRIPSVYDRGIGGRPSENPLEENIYTVLGWVLLKQDFHFDLYRVNLHSFHIENGKRVNHCTRGEGLDDGSRVITKDMCSFAKWQDLVVKAGSGYHPKVVVKRVAYGPNDTLVEGRDYTVAYDDFKRAGVGVATVKGRGKWSGEVVLEYTVERQDISHETLAADPASYTFTGSPIKPKAIKRSGNVLKPGVDYQVLEFANNVNAGTATMKIKGSGL